MPCMPSILTEHRLGKTFDSALICGACSDTHQSRRRAAQDMYTQSHTTLQFFDDMCVVSGALLTWQALPCAAGRGFNLNRYCSITALIAHAQSLRLVASIPRPQSPNAC
eukprot:20262-Heterococcus_DN1.PRE.3